MNANHTDNTPAYKKRATHTHKITVIASVILLAIGGLLFWQHKTTNPKTALKVSNSNLPPTKTAEQDIKLQQLLYNKVYAEKTYPPNNLPNTSIKETPTDIKKIQKNPQMPNYPKAFPKDQLEQMPATLTLAQNSPNVYYDSYNGNINQNNIQVFDDPEDAKNKPLREAIDRAKILNEQKIAKALPHSVQDKTPTKKSDSDTALQIQDIPIQQTTD